MNDIPDGFEALTWHGVSARVRPEARDWVEEALRRGETLSQAAERSQRRRAASRATAADDDGAPWIARSCHVGSRLTRLLSGSGVRRGEPAPFRALRTSEELRSRGLPTPRVVAAAVHPSGPEPRGELVTEGIPDALTLADVLFDPERTGVAGSADRKEALRETGNVIRKLARAGIHHPGLNAENVILRWYAAPDAHVIELEDCRTTTGPDPKAASAMRRGLLRSIRKLERKSGIRIPPNEREILEAAVDGRS